MRRSVRLAVALCLAALAGVSAASAAGPDRVRVTEAGNSRFPERAYILDLPRGMRLTLERVHVFENGRAVRDASLVPASQRRLAVVLLVDTSRSMRGRPIAGALAAARTFFDRRTPNEEVGVATFDRRTSVLLPLTDDPEKIQDALSGTPPLALGTHIYDGVARGLAMFRAARVPTGSIIVLSDGSDTGSRATAESVAATARASHVRIFTVGLRSRAFTPGPLRELARSAGGRYSEAGSAAELSGIYDELGAQLAGEYLLRYRSSIGNDRLVHVGVSVDSVPGSASTGYRTPALPTKPTPPFHLPIPTRFWKSSVALVFISLTIAILIGLALMTLLRPPPRTLRKRMSQFVSIVTSGEAKRQGSLLTGRVLDGTERSLEKTRWWSRFKLELELAEISMPAVQVVLWTFVATVLVAWFVAAVTHSSLLAFFCVVGVPLGVRRFISRKVERRRRQFGDQLPDNLQVLASALRAGHSLVGALSVVVDDAPEPARGEFKRVITDEQLGVPLEDALDAVATRMDNRDLEQVALVAALQRQTGGNSAEVLDRVTDTIRERSELRRLVRSLTAQGRMSRWIVSFLPLVLLLGISALNPGYVEPLFTHSGGRVLLGIAAVMVVAGSLVIRRIVNIKV